MGKHGATRLSFALMLKFFEIEGRFPRNAGEVPPPAVDYVARQLGLLESEMPGFEVAGRSAERHRAQIRDALGFRVFPRGDEDKMIAWLAEQVCPSELNEDRQREAVLARCRAERLEPPGRMNRIIGSANRIADEVFCAATVARLPADVAASSGSPTSCACWGRCVTRCAAGRSGSSAPRRGAIPTPICRSTLTCAGTCTTSPSPSPRIRPSSSPACAPGWTRRWRGSPRRCAPGPAGR